VDLRAALRSDDPEAALERRWRRRAIKPERHHFAIDRRGRPCAGAHHVGDRRMSAVLVFLGRLADVAGARREVAPGPLADVLADLPAAALRPMCGWR
jgi:hypothetical protein